MKARFFSAVLAAMVLACASVGITASAEEAEQAVSADVAETASADHSEDDFSETETDESANGAEVTTETSSVSDDKSDDMEKFREVMSDLAENGTTEVAPDYYGDDYYDTDGNATLIKSERIVYNSEEMQFIAVTTKDGHVFYVLINYSAENAEDQVFFLNKVDDYDLYALLYAGAEESDDKKKTTPAQAAQAAEKANGRVQSGDGADTADDTVESAEDGEDATDSAAQAKPVPMNKNSMMLVFGAIALIGVGGAGFFIMKKKNGGKAAAQAVPDDTEDDEEETMIDEDNEYRFYDGSDDNEDDE